MEIVLPCGRGHDLIERSYNGSKMGCGWHWITPCCMYLFPLDKTMFHTSTHMTRMFWLRHPAASFTLKMATALHAEMIHTALPLQG
jgi:hypothetical protein